MAAILNHHCRFLTQLNCHSFTNHSPLVSWQQYSTTIVDFSLNSTVIHSPTTPLSWQQYSTTYCQFFTQLNCHSFTNHSPLVTWQQYSIGSYTHHDLRRCLSPTPIPRLAPLCLSPALMPRIPFKNFQTILRQCIITKRSCLLTRRCGGTRTPH